MAKKMFKDIDIGTYFKLYGRLFVKIDYTYDDDNVYDFKAKYPDTLEPDDEVEIVDIEITVKER